MECNDRFLECCADVDIASISEGEKEIYTKPHMVQKEVNGVVRDLEEFFITDLVEYLPREGYSTGYIVSDDENEVMGIDDLSALLRAQKLDQHRS